MNVIRELSSFFRQQAGIIFVAQVRDPILPPGVAALCIRDRIVAGQRA